MDSKELLKVVVEAADSKRAEDIVALDVQGISLLADYFVIMQAKDGANWILLDLGDVVVHVFKTETRQFYNLEKLWSDAPLADIDDWIKE